MVCLSLESFLLRLRAGLTHVPNNPAELFGYVDRIIRSVVIEELRRRNGPKYQTQFPKLRIPSDQPALTNCSSTDDALRRLIVAEAVAQLPWNEQMLIDMRYRLDMRPEEIATARRMGPDHGPKTLAENPTKVAEYVGNTGRRAIALSLAAW